MPCSSPPQRTTRIVRRGEAWSAGKNAHRLHRGGDCVRVVRGANRRVPRVQVSTHKNDLVFERGIRARDFGQDVVAVKAVLVEAGADLDAELQRLSGFGQADEHAVLFGGKHHGGHGVRGRRRAALDAHGTVLRRRRGKRNARPVLLKT